MITRIFLCFLIICGCSKDFDKGPIYVAANGVTIKCDASGIVGDTFEINGVTYTMVDETILREMVGQGADVTKVCTTRVTDMSGIFNSTYFNQDIGSWDVSNVIDMDGMFYGSLFNQDISAWDVSNVTFMAYMFSSSEYNQDLSRWNVSSVTSMESMFRDSSFNQDLSGWNVDNVIYCQSFSENTPQWVLPKPNFTNCDPN